MKKLITITSLLLLFTKINAQITTELNYFNNLDSVIVNLDKTNFTSNILYDRTNFIAKLNTFNASENNTSNLTHFEQALSELYLASKEEKFTSVENLRSQYSFDKNIVEIGIINTLFHKLNYKKDEQESGLIYNSNNKKMVEVVNKPPFIEKHSLIIPPLKKNVVGQTINYVFKNTLLFEEDNTKNITGLIANFGNNQIETIISNNAIIQNSVSINYTSSGNKTIEFTVVFSDGTTVD